VVELQEPVSLTFALRYLNSFTKATPLSSQVRPPPPYADACNPWLRHCGSNESCRGGAAGRAIYVFDDCDGVGGVPALCPVREGRAIRSFLAKRERCRNLSAVKGALLYEARPVGVRQGTRTVVGGRLHGTVPMRLRVATSPRDRGGGRNCEEPVTTTRPLPCGAEGRIGQWAACAALDEAYTLAAVPPTPGVAPFKHESFGRERGEELVPALVTPHIGSNASQYVVLRSPLGWDTIRPGRPDQTTLVLCVCAQSPWDQNTGRMRVVYTLHSNWPLLPAPLCGPVEHAPLL